MTSSPAGRGVVFSVCLLLAASALAFAQGQQDAFNPGANDTIYSLTVQPDGKIIVGGEFWMIGGGGTGSTPRSCIARLNPDGSVDTTFDAGANNTVFSTTLQPDGKILVSGTFTMLGGGGTGNYPRVGLGRLNADGSIDPTFNPGLIPGPQGLVGTITTAVQPDGKILVGGAFNGIGGGTGATPRQSIARLNPDGSVDPTFDPGISGGSNADLVDAVYKIVVQRDGKILVAGDFTGLGGGTGATARNHIGRLNPDGSVDMTFNPNANDAILFGLIEQPDLKILVGGIFTNIGGASRLKIARLNADGTADGGFNPGIATTADNGVNGLALHYDGRIVVTGGFTGIGGGTGTTARSNLARLFSDGSVDTGFVVQPNFDALAVAIHANGRILVGGYFTGVNAGFGLVTRNHLAAAAADGNLDNQLINGVNGQVTAIVVQIDGRIALGGSFSTMTGAGGGTFNRAHLARFKTDSFVDPFDPGADADVNVLAQQPDGKLLAGGQFTMLGGGGSGFNARNHIGRLNLDGSIDGAFNPGANANIRAMAVQPDGRILVGGEFSMIGGGGTGNTSRNGLARLDIDGNVDMAFDPGANGLVSALVLLSDGSMIVGGDFTTIGGGGTGSTSRLHLARLNSAGVVDMTFDPGANGNVRALAVQADGKILVGGEFTGLGSGTGATTRQHIGRLTSAGVVDSFDPGANGTVLALAVETNGFIWAGGSFTTLGGGGTGVNSRIGFGELSADGSIDAFNPGTNGTVNGLALQSDGKLLIGGTFSGLGGGTGTTAHANVGRVALPESPSQTLTLTGNHTITWMRSGGLPEVSRATFEYSTNGGVNFTFLGNSTRIAGGWQTTGLNLPVNTPLILRARGFYGTGKYSGSASIAPQGLFATVPGSVLTKNPSVLYFGATKNGAGGDLVSVTPSQDVTVGFTGTLPTWSVTSDSSWLQVTNGSGTGAKKFTVSIVNPGNVIAGATSLIGTLYITSSNAPTLTIFVNLAVQQTVVSSANPFGQMDAPLQNQSGVQGAIGVSGWVLDDVGVQVVKIYRNCLSPDEPPQNCVSGLIPSSPGTALVYIGDAAFVAGVRPDLESAFPTTPQSYRAGWGYLMLTNMLPHTSGTFAPNGGDGPLTLYAIATDMEGHTTVLGRDWTNPAIVPTSITMANDTIAKPFGAIDFPTQGGTISGAVYGNFGWVLTPDLNTIADGTDILMPTNGSTLFVYIDGAPVANVTYNQCRGDVGNPPPGGVYCNDDVASIFGNATIQPPLTPRASNPTKYRNLDAGRGPQGSYALNTTLLANGLHSIAWSATDSNNRVEGIGSRNFMVLNGGSRPLTEKEQLAAIEELAMAPAMSRGPSTLIESMMVSRQRVSVRTGYDLKEVATEMKRTVDGVRIIAIPAMGRVEISLARQASGGYLVTNGELRDLPVGSQLDLKTGVFTWAPPVGYRGTYRLAFIAGGERVLVDVTVQ